MPLSTDRSGNQKRCQEKAEKVKQSHLQEQMNNDGTAAFINAIANVFTSLVPKKKILCNTWLKICLTHCKITQTRFECCGPSQKAPSHKKIRDILPCSPKCREMIKPRVDDSHLNNCYPARARRAIRVRTSAASVTPPSSGSQPLGESTNKLKTDYKQPWNFHIFFPTVCFFAGSPRESRQASD